MSVPRTFIFLPILASFPQLSILYFVPRTRIGPEVFAFISEVTGQPPNGTDDGNFTGTPITQENLDFFHKHGFYIYDGESDYILRPEVMESNFYAWRVTGDIKYLQNAQSVIKSFQEFLEVPGGEGGVSGLDNVDNTTITDATREDDQESFFFAEVMKYLSVYYFPILLTFSSELNFVFLFAQVLDVR